jgi:hypothetical protein
MLYTVLYMPSIRTQIYLTPELRSRLEDVMRREHKPMAQVIREVLETYLDPPRPSADEALKATFGAIPDISVPDRDEWDRG